MQKTWIFTFIVFEREIIEGNMLAVAYRGKKMGLIHYMFSWGHSNSTWHPTVNFINVLCTSFCTKFWRQKLQSCTKRFCAKFWCQKCAFVDEIDILGGSTKCRMNYSHFIDWFQWICKQYVLVNCNIGLLKLFFLIYFTHQNLKT